MISLIFCGDLKYCPYISRYVERFDANKIEYEVLFWNRSNIRYNLPNNYKYFNAESKLGKNKLFKLKDFWDYRKWLLSYLKNTKCDKFILLSTLSGLLIGNELIRRRAKYIFDIRDYSYENILLFYKIEEKIIKNSSHTVISSNGFRNFLPPKYDYVLAHNFNRSDIGKITKSRDNHSFNEKIKIVWNGVVRYFDYQSEIIRALANDARFELIYHGDGPELNRFQEFCKINGIGNVSFTGEYNNKDKADLLSDATIINNCYGYKNNEGDKLKYAISNRFYDGIIYHIPQIVEVGGYKADLVNRYGIGITLDLKGNIKKQIVEYLKSVEMGNFVKRCDRLLNKVLEDDNRYIELIDDFSKL